MDASMEMKRVQQSVAMVTRDKRLPRLKLSDPVNSLRLTFRTKNILINDEIFTIHQLIRHSPSELIKLRNLGYKSLRDVQVELAVRGLRLRKE